MTELGGTAANKQKEEHGSGSGEHEDPVVQAIFESWSNRGQPIAKVTPCGAERSRKKCEEFQRIRDAQARADDEADEMSPSKTSAQPKRRGRLVR